MSDLHAADNRAKTDDDTSVGAVTQGGHGTRRGNSLWWIVIVLAIVFALAAAWATTRHSDIVGQGAKTASRSVYVAAASCTLAEACIA
jgi:flagellar basal body-associated protein FliL